jgi:gliding motility-associated protein GldM
MSIPKEPRQLMINIMYLVLMALLALNVSAEVMNAFQTLDEGNQNSIATVDDQVDSSVSSVETLLEDESKAKFKPLLPAIKEVRAVSTEFSGYVDDLRNQLIDMSGNNNGEVDDDDFKLDHGMLTVRGKKNKDVTTRLLVLGEDGAGGEGGVGEELKAKIIETRQRLIDIYSKLLNDHGKTMDLSEADITKKIQSVAVNMPFSINDESWKEAGRESWSDYKFGHMPVAAVLPLMSQMKSDLKVSEANMVNDMVKIAGGKTVEFDQFFPVFAADRSYVIGGEKITAKVSVGSYSSSLDPANVDLRVNGQRLRVNDDGTADFSITGSGTGQKTLTTSVQVTNPLTGEVKEGKGTFTYEVGQRSVSVSADKMNVFYIGVDNPITVAAAGVASGDVRVNVTGAATKKSGNNSNLVVSGTSVGEAKVNVTAAGQSLGSFNFRVKRIPDPVAKIGASRGGNIKANIFKSQKGLYAELENFDFEAKCSIVGYELIYVPKRADAVPSTNGGGNFTDPTQKLVELAKPGDFYQIRNIKGRCPGDDISRDLGTMSFNIQ